MAVLCLDEWLFHDLFGENGKERQKEAVLLLKRIVEQCDRLVVPQKSPWAQKAYHLFRAAGSSPVLRKAARLLSQGFLHNLSKGLLTSPSGPDPDPRIPEADRYLVRAALAAGATLLVTTDGELLEALRETGLLPTQERDAFLKTYLAP